MGCNGSKTSMDWGCADVKLQCNICGSEISLEFKGDDWLGLKRRYIFRIDAHLYILTIFTKRAWALRKLGNEPVFPLCRLLAD